MNTLADFGTLFVSEHRKSISFGVMGYDKKLQVAKAKKSMQSKPAHKRANSCAECQQLGGRAIKLLVGRKWRAVSTGKDASTQVTVSRHIVETTSTRFGTGERTTLRAADVPILNNYGYPKTHAFCWYSLQWVSAMFPV